MRKGKIDEGKVGEATISNSNHRLINCMCLIIMVVKQQRPKRLYDMVLTSDPSQPRHHTNASHPCVVGASVITESSHL